MARFEIKKASDGQFIFHLNETETGRIILRSERYKAKSSCERGIGSVKTNAPNDSRYERLYASNGQYYFNLKAANGEIIGTSKMFDTSKERDEDIRLVKAQAPDASVVDLS